MTTTALLAGATGTLGHRIAGYLLDEPDVAVRLLLRAAPEPGTAKAEAVETLVARGAQVVLGELTDPASLDAATAGVDVVVSALQGGPEVIVDGQVALARAAAGNGVRRFVPSDFAIDLFSAPEGAPQFDARKQADRLIDALPLEVVHVLNGAFMDMMLDRANTMIFDDERGTVSVFGTGDEPFNLTTVDDTARFTAKIATDPAEVTGVHYVSGAEASWNTIAAEIGRVSGRHLTLNRLGDADDLRRVIADAEDPWSVVPQWYFLCMLTVAPFPTNDNHRYPDAVPTGLHDHLAQTRPRHRPDPDLLRGGQDEFEMGRRNPGSR
jgi:uncharacterized protein YbjT (DUF2867 family)